MTDLVRLEQLLQGWMSQQSGAALAVLVRALEAELRARGWNRCASIALELADSLPVQVARDRADW